MFRGRGGFYRLGENSTADWLLLLGGFFVCAISLVLFSVYSHQGFQSLLNEENSAASSSGTPELSHSFIDRVVGFYEGRSAASNKLLDNPPALVDPSL